MYTYIFKDGVASFVGKSTDEKPTYIETISGKQESIPNGSDLYNIDDQTLYMWDKEASEWLPQ